MSGVQESRHQGQVKFYNIKGGFGFVRDLDDNAEYFVHATAIPRLDENNANNRVLHDGEYVEFDIEDGEKGKACKNVSGIRGGGLLCDSNSRLGRRSNRNSGTGTKDDTE